MECKVIYIEELKSDYNIKVYKLIKKYSLEDMIEENMNHIPRLD